MAGTELAVGILGAGYFGACHARAIANCAGLKLAAICDRDLAQAHRLAADFGGASYADWRQLLAEAAIDVVVIATPHHLHMPMAVAAANAGKHLRLEKPMGARRPSARPLSRRLSATGSS